MLTGFGPEDRRVVGVPNGVIQSTDFARQKDGLLQVPEIGVIRNQVLESRGNELAAVVGVREDQVLDLRESSGPRELFQVRVVVGLDVEDVPQSFLGEL